MGPTKGRMPGSPRRGLAWPKIQMFVSRVQNVVATEALTIWAGLPIIWGVGRHEPHWIFETLTNEANMATDAKKYDVLLTLTFPFLKLVDETAKIGADPAAGIPNAVEVPFRKPVHAFTTAEEAGEYFDAVGADVFNALLDYAADLKLRGAAVNAKRNELTKDPIAEEAKGLTKAGMLTTDGQAKKYTELRKAGTAKVQALVAATA